MNLVLSFLTPLSFLQDLLDEKADFQQTLKRWQLLYDREEPFTLQKLITGQYLGENQVDEEE